MNKYYTNGREIWMRAVDCTGKIGEFNNEKLAQEFLNAMNKQIPMEGTTGEYDDEFICPSCGYEDDGYDARTLKICPDCGQKLKWS